MGLELTLDFHTVSNEHLCFRHAVRKVLEEDRCIVVSVVMRMDRPQCTLCARELGLKEEWDG